MRLKEASVRFGNDWYPHQMVLFHIDYPVHDRIFQRILGILGLLFGFLIGKESWYATYWQWHYREFLPNQLWITFESRKRLLFASETIAARIKRFAFMLLCHILGVTRSWILNQPLKNHIDNIWVESSWNTYDPIVDPWLVQFYERQVVSINFQRE